MRSAPIGLLFSHDIPRLVEVARAVAISTHGHPTALASSIAAAAAVGFVLNEAPPEGLTDHLVEVLNRERGTPHFIERESHDPLQEQTQLLKKLGAVLALPPEQAFDEIGGGWVGEETVAGALYCFLRTPNDFRATVLTAANACMSDTQARNRGRCDSDSIACVAGAIAGAYLGIRAIPAEWIEMIENRDLLFDLGKKLAAKASGELARTQS